MENNDVWGYKQQRGTLILKAVAKDGIMVDINTLKRQKNKKTKKKKNSEGASWVNFEMTVAGRERGRKKGVKRERERERERSSIR